MELLIRPGRMEDRNDIWDLLHANAITWSEERISVELSTIWVMLQDSKMYGVLKGNFTAGELEIEWVAIHPLYPELKLKETMVRGVGAILGLDREQATRRLSNYEPALEL